MANSYIIKVRGFQLSLNKWIRFIDELIDTLPKDAQWYGRLGSRNHVFFFETEEDKWEIFCNTLEKIVKDFDNLPQVVFLEVNVNKSKEFRK
jgi:hypothetical protein